MTCETCLHFQDDGKDDGKCMRFPPHVVDIQGDTVVSCVPIVPRDWFCGEWKPCWLPDARNS